VAWGADPIPAGGLVFYPEKAEALHDIARTEVEKLYPGEEFWPQDIVCLNAAVTKFVAE